MTEAAAQGAPGPDAMSSEGAESAETPAISASEQGGETPKLAEPAPKKKYKVKVEDKEEEVDEDELLKGYQKAKASDKRFQEAASLRKQVDDFVSKIKAGEIEDLISMIPQDKFIPHAEKMLLEHLNYLEMPEAERKILELEKKLKVTEAAEKERSEKELSERRKTFEAKAATEIDQDIGEAIKASGVKPTARFVARIAEHMLNSLDPKIGTGQRLSGKEALAKATSDIHTDIVEYLKILPPDELRKILPTEVQESLRKSMVDQVRASDPIRSKTPQAVEAKGSSKKKVGIDEYFNKLEKRYA